MNSPNFDNFMNWISKEILNFLQNKIQFVTAAGIAAKNDENVKKKIKL